SRLTNSPNTTAIYTLSLHDALPIWADHTKMSGFNKLACKNNSLLLDLCLHQTLKLKGILAAKPIISSTSANRIKPSGVNPVGRGDRKSTRLNSSHVKISYAVFCLKK